MPDRPKKSPAKRASGGASKSAREPLSLERVLGAALVIADREGLDALSMRNLAIAASRTGNAALLRTAASEYLRLAPDASDRTVFEQALR